MLSKKDGRDGLIDDMHFAANRCTAGLSMNPEEKMLTRSICIMLISIVLPMPAVAAEFTLGNWNIQTLVYPGDPKTVFPDDHIRSSEDYADLKHWRDAVSADVMFLQEVTSPAALDTVFPVAEGWEHCISGQFAEAEGQTIAPVCTKSGMTAVKPTTATRVQYPAVALRPNAELEIISAADYKPLDVTFDDNGTIRRIRWGLDLTIRSPAGSTLRVLDVHLKSGCFDDFISFRLWNTDPAAGQPASRACDTLGQQMYPLRKWIEARETAGEAWMIVGDFNRRLDAQPGAIPDEVWIALSGYSADKTGHDRDPRSDIQLFRQPYENMSTCWREFRQPNPSGIANPDAYNILPIEFFIYGTRAATMIVPESEKQFPWANPTPADKMRLSDHCPSSLAIKMD
ncbi:hypothetical protein [Rhizobium leguminosarum]|uniref:hypothetical protein n=1 Tax=Rhizobium leguminosarum TaxID=384 RepID=UPI0021BBF51A|nr:hypothetical protein [Rhizobium leguminosarum]